MDNIHLALNWSTYYVLMLAVLVFTVWAQWSVSSTYRRFQNVRNARGMTGEQAARRILDANGLQQVRIERIAGQLTDHFDPKANVIRLSQAVYDTPSIAAVGVAAHEAGHAVQYATGYAPIRLRNAIVPVTQFASRFSLLIFFIGFLFSPSIATVGFVLYLVVAFFQFVTLPVEFNASHRALQTIESSGILVGEELSGARKVLTAAAMTYVAAMAGALLQLLRMFLLLRGGNRNGRD